MGNLLEDLLAELNKNVFYREFSFSKNKFTPAPGQEMEFADHVVWIDDLLMIYQLKQREAGSTESEESERKWFRDSVIKKGSKQIRDTLGFLKKHTEIRIENQRGHVFDVSSASISQIAKLIVYESGETLPADRSEVRHHTSRTGGGFMHVLPWTDYLGICQTLVTPSEVADYLAYREQVLRAWGDALPSEVALVGQFLSGRGGRPHEGSAEFASRLKQEYDAFDLSHVLGKIAEHIDYISGGSGAETDYYRMLAEFAKLNRSQLKEIKKRFYMCLDFAKRGKFLVPNRVIVPNTGCGFVFIAVEPPNIERRLIGLNNLTLGAKYEQRLDRQVGISFARQDGEFLIDWCHLEFPWQEDPVMEEWLRDKNPFPQLRSEVRERYEFEG